DNLSNGYHENIGAFKTLSNFEFIEGDIRDYETCLRAMDGIEYVSHQAALGSVPRSIKDPLLTNNVNIDGFLNVLNAVRESPGVIRMVYAASSSTYGDSTVLPKVEGNEGKPLSPYAVTKAVNEMYAEVFSNVYGLHTIGLRYFNVFGPKQNPNNPYAAVIPIFCKAFMDNVAPVINGDGETSRDFTFVENAVQANVRAFFLNDVNSHDVYNVACGDQITLNEVVQLLRDLTGKDIQAIYGPERKGDVRHSKASIDKIQKELNYMPTFTFKDGLIAVYEYLNNLYKQDFITSGTTHI
ncbi:MAG: NAD-dependent epimerase/dehydratase family protein, partial [Sediminibacterium sp.]